MTSLLYNLCRFPERPHRARSMIAGWAMSLFLLPAVVACTEAKVQPPARSEVTLFAAASCTDAMKEVAEALQQDQPRLVLTQSFGASSTLSQQIVAGADAQVFLSASEPWAAHLADEGLAEDRRPLLENRLVVIVPKDSTLELTSPQDLTDKAVRQIALADPTSVPAGVYAKEVLSKLGHWDALQPKIAGAADVRQALSFVELGAADAGIVYATDAAASQRVKVAFPLHAEGTRPVHYWLVLVRGQEKNAAAREVYDYLGGEAAAAIFARHGFVPLDADGKAVKPRARREQPGD